MFYKPYFLGPYCKLRIIVFPLDLWPKRVSRSANKKYRFDELANIFFCSVNLA